MDSIRQRGFSTTALPKGQERKSGVEEAPDDEQAHASWLGVSWERDAWQTRAALGETRPDWLIVDHYALDARWESVLQKNCVKLMVIDDLADRRHSCDLLLDQTLGRQHANYEGLVTPGSHILVGTKYALLRPEFAHWRKISLPRRERPKVKTILITMGGVDRTNATGRVLRALKTSGLPGDIVTNVVLGANAPWTKDIRRLALEMPFQTNVLSDVRDMARLMAEADLAIGAAGANTSWERCSSGLPTIVLAVADNQLEIAENLARTGAGIFAGGENSGPIRAAQCAISLLRDKAAQVALSQASSKLCDAAGTDRVARAVLAGRSAA